MKQYEEAIMYFNQAITKDPENINFLMNRAQCLYDMGQYTDTIADLEDAARFSPEDPKVLYKLGLGYYAYEKYKRAIKTLKMALKAEPHTSYISDVYYHIGLAYC